MAETKYIVAISENEYQNRFAKTTIDADTKRKINKVFVLGLIAFIFSILMLLCQLFIFFVDFVFGLIFPIFLIIGILLVIFLWWVPVAVHLTAFILSLIAIIKGKRLSDFKKARTGRGFAIASLIISSLCILPFLFYFAYFAFSLIIGIFMLPFAIVAGILYMIVSYIGAGTSSIALLLAI